LDLTDGNVRAVRDLSRHARLETLQRYDDNRRNFQGGVSDQLAELFGD
jgi:integrase/recombinase XerC